MKKRLIALIATVFAVLSMLSGVGSFSAQARGNDWEMPPSHAPSSVDASSARGNDWEFVSRPSAGNDWE